MPVPRRSWGWLAVVAAATVAGLLVTVPGPLATGQTPPVIDPNPPIDDSCGLDVTLVLDASGSISSSGAVEQVRDAAEAFLDSLANTSSTARVTQFGTVSAELAPSTLVDTAALSPGGDLADAIGGYYNPIPPRVAPANFYQYNSGSPQSSGSFSGPSNSNNQYTNWDQALDQAGAGTPAELVVFVTDGDPTAYDFNQPGDPFMAGPPPDVAFRTDRTQAQPVTLARAVQEANQIKATTRVLAVGVGAALSNPASQQRLAAVSGPQIVRDDDLTTIGSINDVDVALVTDFEDLAQFLRGVVLQLCSPSLTVRKLAQSAGNSDYLPAPGWDITATPSVPGGTFEWILPETASGATWTLETDVNGFVQFQWEPDPPELDSAANVAEVLQPGYTAGRPGVSDDYRCELRDEDGNVRVVEDDFVPGTTDFDIDPIGQEIVTCTIWNAFEYAPAIAISKVNAPTAVRGDLDPAASVTSSYSVTNPGNTPLSNVRVTDDKCAPVNGVPTSGPNVGDINTDGRLDVPETWQFTCTRNISASQDPGTVINEATVIGIDPEGTTVSDETTDDVDVFVPRIALTKLVNGVPQVTVTAGAEVAYTYAATNTGNMPLGTVTLVDDTPPCTSPTPDIGNAGPVLDIGETWNYDCTSTPTGSVINTATVTGTPLTADGGAPFPGPNPVVTATDTAEVDVINPGIDLVKSVAPDLILLEPGSTEPQPVAYAFEATNTGTPTLNRPGATTAGPAKDPGWVVDIRCTTPATYVTGDDDDNDLLDPGETWTFTCPGAVTQTTVNVARITGQPSGPDGVPVPGTDPVFDVAAEIVRVVRPGIDIVKTALVPVVLDLDVDPAPIIGPDVPDPRPAEYLYEVTNTGNVELSLDPDPPIDDICSPLVFVDGDFEGDELLDPDETWIYTCSTQLDREGDGNTPPVTGDESGLVTNTVTATGIPFFEDELQPDAAVSASDIAQVLVIEPGISLTKTASAPVVLLGDDVTYSFVVTNTGDVGLDVLGPIDDTCAPLTFNGGDTNDNGLLDGADSGGQESWTYECISSIGLPAPPATTVVNTAAVLGIDPLGNVYEADDTAEVRVFEPAIDLTKTVSDNLVPTGTEVTYGFEVTNVGGSPVAADDVLADITLVDVSLPPVPSCLRPTFVGGDTNGNDLLEREPAEVWTFTCSAVITEPTTDVAAVVGTGGTQFQPPLPIDVFDIDAAFVQPFTPAIEITKSAAPTSLVGGGPVTYTYLVRNTGDVPLSDVAARIVDDTCSPVSYVSGDEDGDGLLDTPTSIFEDSLDETWTFTCTVTVSATTTNTVVVAGTPTDPDRTPLCANGVAGEAAIQVVGPCDVTDNATAIVTVVEPGTITIIKRTPTPTTETFDFTIGSETFSLARDGTRTVSNVAPGAYTVTEPAKSGWQLASLECTDTTGDSVVTVAERQAVIDVAPGETVTCTFTNRRAGILPSTGNGDLGRIVLFAALMAGLGATLVLVDRKRRPAAS